MDKHHPPIFISGPHGGGKTTLINNLKTTTNLFIENDFDIDFTLDFPSIGALTHFERSLLRIYHRYFLGNYADKMAKANPQKIVLTNRTIYDSMAYINTYHKLKWISEYQFQKLNFVINNFTEQPRAIVLNPPLKTIKTYLGKRRDSMSRVNRDKIFENEDSDIFLKNLRDYFTAFKNKKNILYIEDSGEKEIQKIIRWADNLK